MLEAATDVQRLTVLLARAQRDLMLRVGAALEEEGSVVQRWHVLSLLADGAGHAMAELAHAGAVPPPTLTRLIDSMVADDLVYRKADVRDRRRVLVFASARGRALRKRIVARLERRRVDILPADLSSADLERLSELLAALTKPG
jgi:MarR family transcriptional regulator, organic hydroperoxide resistance regulator